MSLSPVGVCNIALAHLGEQPIASFDDGTNTSKMCGAVFHMVVSQVTQAHPWNCATVRCSLPQLAQPPAFGFAYQYALPVDLLYIQKTNIEGAWRREGSVLLTDHARPEIVYTRDMALWPDSLRYVMGGDQGWVNGDALFASAVAYRLAFTLSKKITGSEAITQAMFKLYEDTLSEAKAVDAMQGTPEVIDGSSWVDVE